MPTPERALEADPHISVVIPTRNRPDDLRRCLASLELVRYARWDVLVVDQSDDERTEAVVMSFSARVRELGYTRMREKGLCRARNAGIQATRGAIIALLDDDCTVDADWLDCVAEAFQRNPAVGLVFGSLKSAPTDLSAFYVPCTRFDAEVTHRGVRSLFSEGGAGASMYLRRFLVEQVGPFDIHLDPGTRFQAGGDTDYYYRALIGGHSVLLTLAITTWHYGARSYQNGDAARLVRGYAYSQGALDMKLLRAGHMVALALIGQHLLAEVSHINVRNLLSRRGPSHLGWVAAYLRGLIDSFAFGVDRASCLYQPAPAPLTISPQAS